MATSQTVRISGLLSLAAAAIVVAIVACPGKNSSSRAPISLTSVAITPANPTIALGTTRQLTATGTFSDGTTQDLTPLATWTSSDVAMGEVSSVLPSKGLATGKSLGSTTISASYGGRTGSTRLTISSAALVTIEVTPTNPQLALGTSTQFLATGTFTDGSTQDLTEQVLWESGAAGTSTISNTAGTRGLAHTHGLGDTAITAALTGISGATTLTVTPAVLVGLEVAPANPSIAAGTSLHFTATGTFSDGTTQELTDEVTWNSSAAAALISNAPGTRGLAQGLIVGNSTIEATHSGLSGSTELTITSASLFAIDVTPALPAIALGTAQAFTATGTFTDGSTQDLTAQVTWTSSNAAVASLSNAAGSEGHASSLASGTTTVTATVAGTHGATVLTVTSATLVSIGVTPSHPAAALGTTQHFAATGIYTDGSSQDLTEAVTWSSSDAAVAAVSNAAGSHGLATTVAVGATTLSATLEGVSGATVFTVSPAILVVLAVSPDVLALARGTSHGLTALGVLSDGTSQDLTEQVTWSSSDEAVASVSNAAGSRGRVVGVAAGTATITAAFAGASGTAAVEVTPATLVALEIEPFVPSMPKGTQLAYTAFGTYTDDSTQDLTQLVTWSSSSPASASISNAAGSRGLATGAGVGSTLITAAFAGVSASVDLEVTAAVLDSIQVTTASPYVAIGEASTFHATGTYSDATTLDLTGLVTWTSSDEAVATISNAAGSKGLVHGVGTGSTVITASSAGKSSTATLTVTATAVVSLSVTPVDPFLPATYARSLQAIATYSDGTTRDVSAQALWSSANTAAATVSNSDGTRGRVTGRVVGAAMISATLPGATASTLVTVTNEVLNSLSVEPESFTLVRGTRQQLTATGYFSGGTELDLTYLVKWKSLSPSIASVDNSARKGLVTSKKVGSTTIRATRGNKNATASLSVSSF